MIVAATGHRPNKLGGYGRSVMHNLEALAVWVIASLVNKPTKIRSGLALGWDQAWAEGGIHLGIPVIGDVPCLGQDRTWPKASQDRYRKLLDSLDEAHLVTNQMYQPWMMQRRNEWMVDHADLVVALWDGGQTGGTANCVRYAESKKKPIINVWDLWERHFSQGQLLPYADYPHVLRGFRYFRPLTPGEMPNRGETRVFVGYDCGTKAWAWQEVRQPGFVSFGRYAVINNRGPQVQVTQGQLFVG